MPAPITNILARAAAGDYGEDSELIGAVFGVVMSANYERGFGPFICGALGAEGSDGLHQGYMVCPAYGADVRVTAAFMRAPS